MSANLNHSQIKALLSVLFFFFGCSRALAHIPLQFCSNTEHLGLANHGNVAVLSCLFQSNRTKDEIAATGFNSWHNLSLQDTNLTAKTRKDRVLGSVLDANSPWGLWNCGYQEDAQISWKAARRHLLGCVAHSSVWKVNFLDEVHMRGILKSARWK